MWRGWRVDSINLAHINGLPRLRLAMTETLNIT